MQQILYSLFLLGKEKDMCIIAIMVTAIISSILTIFIHCCVILAKEEDEYWEEEQITKTEDKEE